MPYLNNGKVAQNYKIKSTPIKSAKVKNFNATNGKLFTQELFVALKENNTKKPGLNKNESTNLSSWYQKGCTCSHWWQIYCQLKT